MATPESLAIRHAEAAEKLADAMQAIRESQDRIETKLDDLLTRPKPAESKPKTN